MRKTLFLLCALLGTVGAWAETINLGNSANIKANATFYLNGYVQTGSAWCDKAVYHAVTLAGSISSYSGYLDAKRSATLTISVPAGATIKGYSFGIQMKDNLTCTANNVALNNSSPVTVSASNLSTNSVTINFTNVTGNECLLELSNFTVNVETYNVGSLKTDGYYYIHNSSNSDKYVSSELKCTTTGSRQLFKISKAIRNGAECYTIYNLSTRKFATYAGNSNGANISGDDAGDNSYWTLTFDGNHWTICPQGTDSYSWNFSGGNNDGNPVKLWNANNNNSKWLLEEASSLTSYAIDGDYEFYTITNHRNSDKVVNSEYKCASSNPGVFRIQKVSGQAYYTIYNMTSKKYVNWKDANQGENKLTEADDISSNSYWDILDQLDSNNIIATICPHGTISQSWNFYGGASDGTAIGLYSSGDGGGPWRLAKQTYNAEYKLFYNNTELTDYSTNNITITKTDPTSAMPESWNRDFCTLTFYSDASLTTEMSMLPASNVTVYVKATWTGPFEISADYASAHWYDMAMRRNWYVTSADKDESGALLTVKANAMGLAENDYQWAFVGDPYHIQVYNKAEGDSKVFNATGVITNQGIPTFSAGPYYWKIVRSTTSIPDAFLLNAPNTNCYINQFGGEGGSLKFWDSTNNPGDEGSAFTVFDVPNDFHEFAAAEIQPYATATGYFTLKDNLKSSIGWNDSYASECPFATYKTMKQTLLAIDMNDMSNYILPETGYYRLKNNHQYDDDGFVDYYYMTYKDNGGNPALGVSTDNTTPTSIIKLTKNDENGKYTVSAVGLYATAPAESITIGIEDTATPVEFTALPDGKGLGAFTTGDEKGAIHFKSNHYCVGWGAVADASLWTLTDATSFNLTIGETGYSTLWVPFAVEIPSGVTAYTGSINGKSLHLNEVEGTTLPANTAVVLAGDANTYTFNITDDVTAITGNALSGSKGNVVGGDGIYALSQKGEPAVVGFYPVGSSVTIPACKAYLEYNNTGGNLVKGFTFVFDEDDPTAIQTIDNGQQTTDGAIIYNVAGQRIQKMQKGINIVNGKKILK